MAIDIFSTNQTPEINSFIIFIFLL